MRKWVGIVRNMLYPVEVSHSKSWWPICHQRRLLLLRYREIRMEARGNGHWVRIPTANGLRPSLRLQVVGQSEWHRLVATFFHRQPIGQRCFTHFHSSAKCIIIVIDGTCGIAASELN